MDKLRFWYFDGIETSKERAIDAYNSRFWESPQWNFIELAYLQYKQARMIMPFEVWHDSVKKTIRDDVNVDFPNLDTVRAKVMKAFNDVYYTKKIYSVNITSVQNVPKTDYTIDDIRYANGIYEGSNISDVVSDICFMLIKSMNVFSACPGFIGGDEEFCANWSIDLSDDAIVYFTVYMEQHSAKTIKSFLR